MTSCTERPPNAEWGKGWLFRLLTKSPDCGSGGPAQALASSPFCHVAVDDIESIIHLLSGCICKVTPTYMTHLDLDRTFTSLSLRSR